MNDNPDPDEKASRLSAAGWFTVAVLMGFLVWAGWYAVHSWTALDGVQISTLGWVFLVLGVVFTLGLGAGLMALVFYSSRENYDR
jgi:hypothetical protein